MQIYNNTFFCSVALFSVLKHKEKWKLSEVALVLPIITQAKVVLSMNRRRRDISLLDLIVDKPEYFYNFNKMFYSYKTPTINSVLFLDHMNLISYDKEHQELSISPNYPNEKIKKIISKNKRLKLIDKNGEKFSSMLKEKADLSELYIQLGVRL